MIADLDLPMIDANSDSAGVESNLEQEYRSVERSRTDIDAQLSAAKEAVENLQLQFETAKLLIAEVTTLHNTAQAMQTQIVTSNAQAAATLQMLQEGANRVESIKVDAEQSQSVIVTKSDHIEGALTHADKVRADIDRLFTEAQQSSTNAEAQHQVSRAVSENLTNLYASAQTAKANIDSTADTVTRLRQQCEEYAVKGKALADIAVATESTIDRYETRLLEFNDSARVILKTIEGLLPGAASAGLASAFNQRREHFKWPQRIWQGVFVASLLALLGIAALEFSLFNKPQEALTWDGLGLSLLHRLPFALPLIWLAFHASHKAALAQRVEEDYAFKETVSRSFEGYRRETGEIKGEPDAPSALSRLCEGVLSIITNPPGRLYENHQLNKTPLNALAESARPLADAAPKPPK